ncbi:MAG: NAD(+) synthase [Parcubacteria group bacterium]|nr:NAD(+) synthase [Parcubacteria group bacterium]
MRLIKIGIGNINTTVGAFVSNTDLLLQRGREMAEAECTVGCFQELSIGGYPAEDLVQWRHFVSGQWEALNRFAKATTSFGLGFPTVFVIGVVVSFEGQLYNAAAVVSRGKIWGIVPKEKLPTYGVFYEGRVFAPGTPHLSGKVDWIPFGDLIFKTSFGTFAVEVCEDMWSPDGPMRRRSMSGAELVVNISASPFRVGVLETRREMIATRAADNQVTVVYANHIGGNDALVFDGGGFVNQNGTMLCEVPRWKEGVTTQVVDLDRTARLRTENTTWRTDREHYFKTNQRVKEVEILGAPQPNQPLYQYPVPKSKNFFIPDFDSENRRERHFEDLIQAMIMGLDYFDKTKAFQRIGIALSGGKDSALTLIIAWLYALKKFGGDRERARAFIHCFSMPTRFNSEGTKTIASELARELDVTFKEVSIAEAFERECEAAKAMLAEGEELSPTTIQNIQARIRATRMWNWANSVGGLFLQTGNMSEKAVGYTTIGGDLSGGYSLIGNLPKTVVIELLRYMKESFGLVSLGALLETKASAELAPNQFDEDDLMPFPVLDACFALFAGEKLSPKELYLVLRSMWSDEELEAMAPRYKEGMLKEWVKRFVKLFSQSIFKWVQAPQAVHLGTLDLDRERALQLPVVHSNEWLEESLKEIDVLL